MHPTLDVEAELHRVPARRAVSASIDSSTASMDRWTDLVRAATISAMLVPDPGQTGDHDEATDHATLSGVI